MIDIGCGFDEARGQASISEAVGIDLNFESGAPMVVLIKLGLLKTRLTVDEYAEVVIPISQTPKEKANNG